VLPLQGLPAVGLPGALRDGARLEWSSVTADTLSQTVTQGPFDGPVTHTQDAEESALRLARGQAGLELSGSARGSSFAVEAPDLPAPIAGTLAEAGGTLDVPLLASPTRQPFAFGLTLRDLALGDAVWDLADPGRALPREPLSLDLALGGEVVLPFDLPDLDGLAALATADELPSTSRPSPWSGSRSTASGSRPRGAAPSPSTPPTASPFPTFPARRARRA
jgi:hypothetical protein